MAFNNVLQTIFLLFAVIVVNSKAEEQVFNVTEDAEVIQNGIFGGDKEICMKELGCFSITDDFKHMIYRPINPLPNDRAIINTRLLLYTKKNFKEPDMLVASDPKTITESHLNPEHPVKFIVHGYMDSELFGPWMWTLKDEILMHNDYNVIIVDWSGGNHGIYPQAASNTRVVGAEIEVMIKALNKYMNVRAEDCHIIGHSLGSHVAGYAGERLKDRHNLTLGRITGCDPAEPFFQYMPRTVRLDETDADYVDVIHSDATSILLLGFGMSQMCGHADFFPNNGRKQPGCRQSKITSFINKGFVEGSRRFVACDHQRSLDFMINSINYIRRVPVAYECSDWETFLQGKCADCGSDMKKCAIMGIRADEYKQYKNNSVQHAFYVKTSASEPFWLYHYQISIKLYKPRFAHKDVSGSFEITLHGSKEDFLTSLESEDKNLYPGARYQYLITTDKELGEIKSITLKWYSASKNPIGLIFKPKLYVHYITVVPMFVMEKSPRNMTDRVFCHDPDSAMLPKVLTYFHRDNECLKYLFTTE